MNKLETWINQKKERKKLAKDLEKGNLSFSNIIKFHRVLSLNEIDINDHYACRIGMQSNECFQITFGRQGWITQEPELKINLIVARSSSIRVECIYTTSATTSYNETVTFAEKVDVNCIRDDKPNDYASSADRIETIKNVICSSMLYTLQNYIKRWY